MHDSYPSEIHGAAKDVEAHSPSSVRKETTDEDGELNVLKINFGEKGVVLLRTSAVKIIDPATGNSSLVYAQLDTASQATLISEALKTELGLQVTPDPTVSLRTLARDKVSSGGRTSFKLESLYTGEQFNINNALVVPKFSDDEKTLPHAVDVSGFEHFEGV